MPLHFTRCYFCCSLRTGALVTGAAYTAGSVALAILQTLRAIWRFQATTEKTRGEGVLLLYHAVMFAAEAAVSVMLVIGIVSKRPVFVKVWFVYSVSASVLMTIVIIIWCGVLWGEQGQVKEPTILFVQTIAAMVLATYSFLVVDSYYAQQQHSRWAPVAT